jgi:hypothetical protein
VSAARRIREIVQHRLPTVTQDVALQSLESGTLDSALALIDLARVVTLAAYTGHFD